MQTKKNTHEKQLISSPRVACISLSLFILLIKHICILILQPFRFFVVEFLELISLIGLSYSSNNVTISMTICVEVRFFFQFCLLHEMLHNLGV
jgi:hypothetical protein